MFERKSGIQINVHFVRICGITIRIIVFLQRLKWSVKRSYFILSGIKKGLEAYLS